MIDEVTILSVFMRINGGSDKICIFKGKNYNKFYDEKNKVLVLILWELMILL